MLLQIYMSKLIINGGKALHGTVKPVANKNTIIKLIPAALLTDEDVIIHNVPMSSDVKYMLQILELLGWQVEVFNNNSSVKINCAKVHNHIIDAELSDKMKASVMFMWPLLVRFGKATMPTPQGCKLGTRPLDALIENMITLGATYKHQDGTYFLTTNGWLKATEVRQRFPSVTGTENLILLASRVPGKTTIYNAACEPHTQELCHFLNSLWANITGIWSNKLEIIGIEKLSGGEWTCDSDHLDVGGFIAAAVLTGGELTITHAVTRHMGMILQVYKKLWIHVEVDHEKDQIFVPKNQKLTCAKTLKWDLYEISALQRPLFPADLVHTLAILALKAQWSMMFRNIFYEYSFFFIQQLAKMKAITVMADPTKIVTYGPTEFKPATMVCSDIIQASYAMMLAALATKWESTLLECDSLFRRYPDLVAQFNALGAEIRLEK